MRSATSAPSCPAASTAVDVSGKQLTARFADYLELAKPRISLLVLVTVAVGYALGSIGEWDGGRLCHALLGIALVAVGSSALNQFYERHSDAFMRRTANRPLPSGRLQPAEVLVIGMLSGSVGVIYLALCVNIVTAALALLTFLLYTLLYTPLKRVTCLCTAVGAVPGALPPVLGWTAAGGPLDVRAFALFAILFLWQFPHFLAIAWLYREEYLRAGLRMLPAGRPASRITGLLAVGYALVLLPVSLLPSQIALAGNVYFTVAVVLGLAYLASAIRFLLDETTATARRLLWCSLVYLPVLLLTLTWDHWWLLQ